MIRLFLLGLLLISQNALAQLTLLKDISHIYDAQTSGLNPKHITNVNGTLFFSGLSDKGFELWKSDGTLGGTVLVKDIFPGSESSSPSSLVNLKGTLYFVASDGVHGKELWKSDGTEAGTTMVEDISPEGYEPIFESPKILGLKAVGNYVYFFSTQNYPYNLWRSDGTPDGTFIIREQVSDSWQGFSIIELNGTAYFTSGDPVTGYELWKTDGTKDGTSIVKDIVPGLQSSAPRNFIVYNSMLFFTCMSSAGYEVWKSDGTEAGTVILKDIEVGPSNSEPQHLHVINNTLIFQAYDGASLGLWKSNGTEAGTVKIVNTETFSSSRSTETMVFYTNEFVVDFHLESKLWRTDGTAAGTVLVKQFASPFYISGDQDTTMFPMNDAIYFTAASGNGNPNNLQIWRSDGTTAGTSMLTSVNFFDEANGILFNTRLPNEFTVMNNNLYFCTNDVKKGNELWKTDGTVAGTTMITDMPEANYGSVASDFTKLNDLVIFSAADEVGSIEIWRSDKTAEGTFMLRDIYPGGPSGNSSLPAGLTTYHDYVYFSAVNDVNTGTELWRTDGSTAGTQLFKDFNLAQYESSYPANFKVLNDFLLFTANSDELWKTDGTLAGTQLIKDVVPGRSSLSAFAEFNGKVYFLVANELWKSDGTTSGTVKVSEITIRNYNSMFATSDKLFLTVLDQDLWVSDGTEAGTSLIKHFQSLSPIANTGSYAAVTEGTLFFKAMEENSTSFTLWKTDGTVAGTSKVSDIHLGFPNTEVIAAVNGSVLFTAYDEDHGVELWKADATSPGIQRLTDIWGGAYSSDPSNFVVVEDRLYFTAYDGINRALWKTNGEESGTVKVTNDANISLDRYHKSGLIDNTIFIRGYEIETGEEVYMYNVEDDEPVTGTEGLTASQIFVYPNPASQKLRIQTPQLEGKKEVRVISTSGIEYSNNAYSSIDFDLDVSAFPTGLYVLQIISSKGISVTKFVKK